ncbi:MAG: MFS transporter [Ktedonobacterales bacterium]|nr:MFS transporter [Ktedonobacterales bacterium]
MNETLREDAAIAMPEPLVIATPAQRQRWTLAYTFYTGFTSLTFTNAVWVIYLATHGYSAFTIGLFETVFHVAKFIAEVPTGAFADLIGRRASLIVANVLGAVEVLFFLMPSPPLMILSFTLAGASFAFRGGAAEAILWSITRQGDADDHARYSRVYSQIFILISAGQLVGSALGGVLGGVLIFLPFLCQMAAYLIGTLGLLPLPEQRGIAHVAGEPRISALGHVRAGWQLAWRDPALAGLLLISGLIECIWATTGYYSQLYLYGRGFSLAIIGGLAAAGMLVSIAFTAITPWLMRRLRELRLLVIFFVIGVGGLVLLSGSSIALYLLGFVVVTQAAPSVLSPAISTYVNARSPEAQRATVLSFQTALFSLAMIVLFPLFGLGVTHTTYGVMFLVTTLALVLAGGGVGVMVWWRSRR